VLVPGPEAARPPARDIHRSDHGVLTADVAQQIDGPVEEDPPEVCVVTLAEQDDTWLDADLDTVRSQVGELAIAQAIEQTQSPELAGLHQTVAK
jgi:hypothetical protein